METNLKINMVVIPVEDRFWNIEFHKTRKDYVIHLQKKSLPNKKNISKLPKVGVKMAEINKDGALEIYERIAKDKQDKVFKLLGTYTPTKIEYGINRIYYYTQKFLHRDIIEKQKQIELYLSDKRTLLCSGEIAAKYLFNELELPAIIQAVPEIDEETIAEMEIEQMVIEEDARQQEDFYNIGEDAPF